MNPIQFAMPSPTRTNTAKNQRGIARVGLRTVSVNEWPRLEGAFVPLAPLQTIVGVRVHGEKGISRAGAANTVDMM
jgi:hypothetical protein